MIPFLTESMTTNWIFQEYTPPSQQQVGQNATGGMRNHHDGGLAAITMQKVMIDPATATNDVGAVCRDVASVIMINRDIAAGVSTNNWREIIEVPGIPIVPQQHTKTLTRTT